MPKPYPQEFGDDVVAGARQGQAPLNQIAKYFGISEGCLHNWLKKRNRLLEQENEVLSRAAAYLSQANLPGKSSFLSSVRWPRPRPES